MMGRQARGVRRQRHKENQEEGSQKGQSLGTAGASSGQGLAPHNPWFQWPEQLISFTEFQVFSLVKQRTFALTDWKD